MVQGLSHHGERNFWMPNGTSTFVPFSVFPNWRVEPTVIDRRGGLGRQVGRLVRRPGGPLRQMWKGEGVPGALN